MRLLWDCKAKTQVTLEPWRKGVKSLKEPRFDRKRQYDRPTYGGKDQWLIIRSIYYEVCVRKQKIVGQTRKSLLDAAAKPEVCLFTKPSEAGLLPSPVREGIGKPSRLTNEKQKYYLRYEQNDA